MALTARQAAAAKLPGRLSVRRRNCGGLGIPDLRILGFALRLHWEWLRRTDPNSTWAALPYKEERMITSMFRASVIVRLGDGASAMFWTDSWLPPGPLSEQAPHLYQAICKPGRKWTVREALLQRRWVRDISGAPTMAVLYEYATLWERLEDVVLQPATPDRFI